MTDRLGSLLHADSPSRILQGLAPAMMTPSRIAAAAAAAANSSLQQPGQPMIDFATLGRAPLRLSLARRVTARDLSIQEATDALLREPIPDTPAGEEPGVSFMRGFTATVNSAEAGRSRRRKARNVDMPHLGLKSKALAARGMLTAGEEEEPRGAKRKARQRQSLSSSVKLGPEELARQKAEIMQDRENIHVRRSLINNEIAEITHKIAALDVIRNNLEQDLLRLHEDELELEDELTAVQELQFLEGTSTPADTTSSRRRKGPAFLPSEHDDLPPNIAFMTLATSGPVAALDFSEPYGLLVTASASRSSSSVLGAGDSDPRMWDLCAGQPVGRLRGAGAVRALQVQGQACVTGGSDGVVRVWDMRRVPDEDELGGSGRKQRDADEDFVHLESADDDETGCVRVLEGHSKAVTALYFEDDCMVTGASDKTIRQWDVATGQCVLTMDILWAIAHPGGADAVETQYDFSQSIIDHDDRFVGGLQFWGYALVSGSADGAVRMWDMRTGQAHRTLLGHTAPITAVQFDETNVVSSSRDGTVRIWDLRSGGRNVELLRFGAARQELGGVSAGVSVSEYSNIGVPSTSSVGAGIGDIQFDTRKIVVAGDSGIEIFNRTTQQYNILGVNGHVGPVERVRYMDRYLISGGQDATVKIWAL